MTPRSSSAGQPATTRGPAKHAAHPRRSHRSSTAHRPLNPRARKPAPAPKRLAPFAPEHRGVDVADGTLFIVRNSFSRAAMVRQALELLYQRQAKVLGFVFNRADASSRSYYYYKQADYYLPGKAT